MKLNITPGPWAVYKHPDTNNVHYVNGLESTQGRTATCYTGERPDDATAIVTAVNNTYHKGINPEAVPKMKANLDIIIEYTFCHDSDAQKCLEHIRKLANQSLQKATL